MGPKRDREVNIFNVSMLDVITGALGYFLIPFDIIPDPLIPIIGFTDDIIVLSVATMVVTSYIDTNVVEQARAKLTDWFGTYDVSKLEEIENAAKKGDDTGEAKA